ncbi:MAG TPA: 2,3-dihydroxyphenylpropionate 1,2-dioxygenase [Alphaproteobacteria bacterium]|jgi:aromatic ring-opening dioxygenase catalytic subunit (LigB family)
MGEIVAVLAASHAPLIARDWPKLPPQHKQRLTAAFNALGARLNRAKADVLVIVSPDHWINFFINNLPSICIGVGEAHEGPPEPFLKEFPWRPVPGHPGLANHIYQTALANEFEPSVSHRMALDHGFCLPLWRMEPKPLPRIVPIVVNTVEAPFPRVSRCLAWGKLVAKAVASYSESLRVAVLATGGLSHSIGEPTMGAIDEKFDERCIAAFKDGREAPLVEFLEAEMDGAGNGSHECRNWIVAHGAAGSRGFELVDYLPVPEVYVGCGFAAWNLR